MTTFRSSAWLRARPAEDDAATLLIALAERYGWASLSLRDEHAWRAVAAELEQLRAALSASYAQGSGFRVQLGPQATLTLGPVLLSAGTWRYQLDATTPTEDDAEEVALALGSAFGVINGPTSSTVHCCAEVGALLAPGPGGAPRRSSRFWFDLPADTAILWAEKAARLVLTGSVDPPGARAGRTRTLPRTASGVVGGVSADSRRAPAPLRASYQLQPPREVVAGSEPLGAAPPVFVVPAPPVVSPSAPLPPTPLAVPERIEALTTSTEPINLEKLRGILLADPTPFLGKTTLERLAELKAEAGTSEETHFAPPDSAAHEPDADETAMFNPSPAEREKLQTLPFARAATPPDLTVDRYAAMAAELQVKGPLPSILERYGVTDTGLLLALQAEQERRFIAAPTLRARFEERKAHFLLFLQEPRR